MKIRLSKSQWIEMGRHAGWINRENGSSDREEMVDEFNEGVNSAWSEAISLEIQEDIEHTMGDLDDIDDVDGFLTYLKSSSTQFAKYLLSRFGFKINMAKHSRVPFDIKAAGMEIMSNIVKLSEEFIDDSKEEFTSSEYGTYEDFVGTYKGEEELRNDPYKSRGLMRNEF